MMMHKKTYCSTLLSSLVFCFVAILPLRAAPREDTRLDAGWRFQPGDATNSAMVVFDDSGWQVISLPHNWGWEQAQAGKEYYRGPGWYRRALDIIPINGKRYFLRFEAASLVADVYLNGTLLGQHRGGFGAFCFEITQQLSATGTNLLAVRVSNETFPDIAPLSGDFCVYGGLYRPVHLLVTDAENFALTDHGSSGVAWLQTSVTPEKAVLDMTAQISNGTSNPQPLKLVARVLDAAGNVVVSTNQNITLAPQSTAPYLLRLVVPQPHLWNGRKDPYLYRAVVELRKMNDAAVDEVDQPLGLRFYFVDPDQGFFLNGQSYHLHGVNRHQERAGRGWAITEEDMDEDMSLLKELGVTVIRCAHYQHSDYFYSLCDRAGILVWAEIPQVNMIRTAPEFENTSRSQLLDLIRQNVNHPAIFAWSLFNEVGNGGTEDPHRELQNLNNLAHGEDPTRPTIAATCVLQSPQMNKIPDLIGWNIYPGWYASTKETYGYKLDLRQATSRHGGFCVSEYGAGANTTQHEQDPQQPKPSSQWHPEEWQAAVHETAWAAIKARPFVWGSFVWVMFDFAVNKRHEGGQVALNDKGLVTRDRKIKKDAFYFYKANWSDEPVLYITSRRFTERTNALTDVKVYSNLQEPELFINGRSQGKRYDGTNAVFIWKNLQLKFGENSVKVRAKKSGQPLTDQCTWTLN